MGCKPRLQASKLMATSTTTMDHKHHHIRGARPPRVQISLHHRQERTVTFRSLRAVFRPPFNTHQDIIFVPHVRIRVRPHSSWVFRAFRVIFVRQAGVSGVHVHQAKGYATRTSQSSVPTHRAPGEGAGNLSLLQGSTITSPI